jgi:mRNA interferase MazF
VTRGRIVLVPFPFDDLSSSKVRPALCLTDPVGPHRHVVLAFITSRVPSEPDDTDLIVDPSKPEGKGTGLKVPSAIRLHRMMTLSTSVIRRELGTLPPALHPQVASKLANLFGIDLPSKAS